MPIITDERGYTISTPKLVKFSLLNKSKKKKKTLAQKKHKLCIQFFNIALK